MYARSTRTLDPRRRGVILLVVITLLTLFAAVGLTFVIYAESQATASRIFREAQDEELDFYGEDPDTVFSYALGQLIYDGDDMVNTDSSLRGHSLARSMFGYNHVFTPPLPAPPPPPVFNQAPFNGVGWLRQGAGPIADNAQHPNYQFFAADGFVRDPERYGTRANPTTAVTAPYVGCNVPYTYPDHNNMYLAGVKADGTMLVPSFHRPWVFGTLDPSNPEWTTPTGKYKTLRPRPVDMGPGFPMPGDPGGDVRNRQWGPAGNDSVWIDLGYPVRTMPDGRKYKPLFAFLVKDLDSLMNVNVHGNILGTGNTHNSNQGWGKWEPSLAQVLNAGAAEWNRLLLGNGTIQGRYGPNGAPGNPGLAPRPSPLLPTSIVPMYSSFDYNGGAEPTAGPSVRFDMPASGTNPRHSAFPLFGNTWNSASPITPAGNNELTNHPSLADFYRLSPGDDRLPFDASELQKLFCHIPNVTSLATSDLAQLCPLNFNNDTSDPNCVRRRRMITTHSFDFDTPGVTPFIWDPATAPYQLAPLPQPFPVGTPIPFPTPGTLPVPAGSDFGTGTDWRALWASLPKVDLSRPMTPYPAPGANGAIDLSSGMNGPQYATAQGQRQTLARDVFIRLCVATGTALPFDERTGAPRPVTYTTPEQGDAARWLGQLAVNIVDFIDEDDYFTPFHWNPNQAPDPDQGWVVFGTELPRLLINEFYIEFVNAMNDPPTTDPMHRATMPYDMKVWVELHNPLPGGTGLTDAGNARLEAIGGAGNPPYQLLVTKRNTNLDSRTNVRGNADTTAGQVYATVIDWKGTGTPLPAGPTVAPAAGQFSNPAAPANPSFLLVGPEAIPADVTPGAEGDATLHVTTNLLKFPARDSADMIGDPPPPTILLRRLANPHLPENTTLGDPLYNPYVTVDYVDTRDPGANPSLQINRAIISDTNGWVNAGNPATAFLDRKAYGRRHPYSAENRSREAAQPSGATPMRKRPQHTFLYANSNTADPATSTPPTAADTTLWFTPNITPALTTPSGFDWLVHLDRPLVNPLELLNVSGFRPHELTQRFILNANSDENLDTGERFLHRAPWTTPQTRIFRALEWLTVRDRSANLAVGGRIPGRININTVWDPEVLLSLIDPQTANRFATATDVYDGTNNNLATVWGRLLQIRSPGLATGTVLDGNNRPFRSLASPETPLGGPQYPTAHPYDQPTPTYGSSGLDTVLGGVFRLQNQDATLQNPYLESELLNKIFGNVTTRSNVFACWLTVGYFAVTDDRPGVVPVKLGTEMRTRGGGNIRQQVFAVLDRTGISMVNPGSTNLHQTTTAAAMTAPGRQQVAVAAVTGTGPNWAIQPGTLLRVGDFAAGTYEVVQVINVVAPNLVEAEFTRIHAAGAHVAVLGNPGPQPAFDYRSQKYAPVVLTQFQLQ